MNASTLPEPSLTLLVDRGEKEELMTRSWRGVTGERGKKQEAIEQHSLRITATTRLGSFSLPPSSGQLQIKHEPRSPSHLPALSTVARICRVVCMNMVKHGQAHSRRFVCAVLPARQED